MQSREDAEAQEGFVRGFHDIPDAEKLNAMSFSELASRHKMGSGMSIDLLRRPTSGLHTWRGRLNDIHGQTLQSYFSSSDRTIPFPALPFPILSK